MSVNKQKKKNVDDNGFFPNPFTGQFDFQYIRGGSAHFISYPGGTMSAPSMHKLRVQWNTRQGRKYTTQPRISVKSHSYSDEIKDKGLASRRPA
jgi:hypothetical protein